MGIPVQGNIKNVNFREFTQKRQANIQGQTGNSGAGMRFRPRGNARPQFAPRMSGPPGMRPIPPPHAMGPPMMGPPHRGQRPMAPPNRMMMGPGPRGPPMMGPPAQGMHPPTPMGMRPPPPHMMGGRSPVPPALPQMRGRGPAPFRQIPPNQKRKFGQDNFRGVQGGKIIRRFQQPGLPGVQPHYHMEYDMSKKWVTDAVKKEFAKKEELLSKAKTTQTKEDWAIYREQRDKFRKAYHTAEMEYIGQQEVRIPQLLPETKFKRITAPIDYTADIHL